MVNQFVLANRTGGLGLIYNSDIRPMYYVFQMYHHFGNEQVYADSGVKYVSIYAAKRDDGTLTIMLINLSDAEVRISLKLEGMQLSTAEVWLFDATHKAESLGKQAIPRDGGLDLPAQSISLYVIAK
jgi:hypothetical protein